MFAPNVLLESPLSNREVHTAGVEVIEVAGPPADRTLRILRPDARFTHSPPPRRR